MRSRGFKTDEFFADMRPSGWRLGYLEVQSQSGYFLGDRSHVLITMLKPVCGETLTTYLDAVPRDRTRSA